LRYYVYSTIYGLIAYYVIGFLKGGWYLGIFQGFFPEIEVLVIFLGGITQTLVAVVLFGIPANWISEYLRNKEINIFKNIHVTSIGLAAIIAALHASSLLAEGSMIVEFISMWAFLAPIPIILRMDEKHIRENRRREGKSWY
jgi:hypothetical protein